MKFLNILLVVILHILIAASYCQAQSEPSFKRTSKEPSELLQVSLKKGEAIIWHLYHSGFAVKTENHLLIFDYWPGQNPRFNKTGLAFGSIEPDEIKTENVIVFISHEHHDHWYRKCLDWKEKVKRIHYVVSPEVSNEDPRFASQKGLITSLLPNTSAQVGEAGVKTLLSTDSGLAYLVKVDGLTIYHSGDHACWNWKNSPHAESEFVTKQLAPLNGEKIDIAMHVCDPRLKSGGWGGIFAFAKKYKPTLLIPMHFKDNYAIMKEVESVLKDNKVSVSFWSIRSRGDCIIFQPSG